MRNARKPGGAACALAAAAGLVASSLVGIGSAPSAAAAPATLGLDYHCTFPLLGAQPVHVELSTDVPSSVRVGQVMPGFKVGSVSTVGAAAARGLTALHSASLEGNALAEATLTVPEEPDGLGVEVDSALEKTPIPATGGFTVKGEGTSPDLTFTKPGQGKVTVGNLVLTLTPRTGDGGVTGLGTFESECTQDPGQDNVLARFEITDGTTEPVTYAYTLAGSAALKAAGGTIPLTGAMTAEVGADGAVDAGLVLDPAKAQLRLLGFLPVTADVAYVPQGRTTGTLKDGVLTTTSKVTVRIPAVSAFGVLPIGGGDQCRTATPSDLTLTSEGSAFDPAAGGRVKGTHELAALTDCGALTGLLSSSVAGPGSTVALTLTPKQKS